MNIGFEASVKKAAAAIRRAKSVMIVSHVNPDGDTLGCQLALGHAILLLGKKVLFYGQDGVPVRFQFLPGSELVISEPRESADLAIAVDCGSQQQLGNMQDIFFKAKKTIQVDHHDYGQPFGKIQVVENEAAAVGEIVYEIIHALKIEVTPAIATCLLTSIIVDTGSFRFSNLRARTFHLAGHLMQYGIDIPHLIEESYWKKSRSMAKLSGYCISRTEFTADGHIAWATVYQKDFKRFGGELSDVDAVADDMRSIDGVKVAAIFRETPRGRFRVSLRSSYGINVAKVAQAYGGGGHHNSAGCSISNSEKEKKKLLGDLTKLIG